MWKCHKCGKPVFFAERKQSLGYDWHPECLRCEECGKRLNPGQHAEHKGIPYCHVPCYGALFGPQLFGHGTRVESHKSFGVKGGGTPSRTGVNGPSLPRDHFESKLKVYNQFFDNKSHEIRSREVNGRLVLEGALRVYWGVQGVIHLKEDDDQRTVITVRKRNSCRYANSVEFDSDKLPQSISDKENFDGSMTGIEINTSSLLDGGGGGGGGDATDISMTDSISFDTCSITEDIPFESGSGTVQKSSSLSESKDTSPDHKSATLPSKLDVKKLDWDEIDDLLQVERKINENEKLYQTLPSPLPSQPTSIDDENSYTSTLSIGTDVAAQITSSSKIDNPMTITSDETSSLAFYEFPLNNGITVEDNNININNDTENILGNLDDQQSSTTSTLKNVDYDEFKKQTQKEFLKNTSEMKTVNDDTLKSNQPIDPSRINDSLKLYSENIMSKSYSGEASPSLRICPSSMQQYQTLNSIDPFKIHDTLSLVKNDPNLQHQHHHHHHHRHHHHHHHHQQQQQQQHHNKGYALQKSGSASAKSITNDDDENTEWLEKSLNRSKSGPNWYGNSFTDSDSETLKPATIKKLNPSIALQSSYHITKDDKNMQENINGINVDVNRDIDNSDDETTLKDAVKQSDDNYLDFDDNEVVLRKQPKTGSTAIKRRSGNKRNRAKLKRRCSINGHFYNRETSFFTPPHGSQMSVWVTSLVNTQEVVNLLLEKYKVDSRPENFALFIIRDNGEQRRLKDDDYPLIVRVMLGPHEDIAKLFLTDLQSTTEISSEVAQFLNLSIPECRSIIDRYTDEMDREISKIKEKYSEMRRRIIQRMESLKVRL